MKFFNVLAVFVVADVFALGCTVGPGPGGGGEPTTTSSTTSSTSTTTSSSSTTSSTSTTSTTGDCGTCLWPGSCWKDSGICAACENFGASPTATCTGGQDVWIFCLSSPAPGCEAQDSNPDGVWCCPKTADGGDGG